MPKTLHIDFVSDIVCPWCVVGLGGLEAALETLKAEGITAEVHFQPFELNPQMPPEGENIVEHIGRKYGSTPEQSAANRAMITQRAAEAWPGFDMRMGEDSRIWNTFDAHRLLHLAREHGRQDELKGRLMDAYFTEGRPIGSTATLEEVAVESGLDRDEVRAVLSSDRYAADVRADEDEARALQVGGVPFFVFDRRLAASGAQPPEVLLGALRQAWQAREASS